MKRFLMIKQGLKDQPRVDRKNGMEIHYRYLIGSRRNNRYNTNILNFTKEAIAFARNKNIDTAIGFSDVGSLVAAAVNSRINGFGPSFKTVLRSYNKYLTRKIIPDVRYTFFDISSIKNRQKLDYPFFIKAPNSSLTFLGYEIQNKYQFNKVLPVIQKELPKLDLPFYYLVKEFAGQDMANLYSGKYMLFEEIMDYPQITIDGYVYQGKIVPTIITDSNLLPSSRIFESFSLPTKLNSGQKLNLVTKLKTDIKKIGLNNTYFNAEYWVIGQNESKLIEINSRPSVVFNTLFKKIFKYDVKKHALNLACNVCETEKFRSEGFGSQVILSTRERGVASDVFNFEEFKKDPPDVNLQLFVKPDTNLNHKSEMGTVLGLFNYTADSKEIIIQKSKEIRSKYLIDQYITQKY